MMAHDEHDDGDVTRRALAPPMLLTGLVVTLARWAFSSDRNVYHLSPDEPSQLAIARWLAGGTRWNMFDHATWQPGLGTLLSPIYWFTEDAATVIRLALGVNAVIAGVSAMLLVRLTQRLTGMTAVGSAIVATIAGVAPASLSASSFVWAEPLVTLSFLATVTALLHWFDRDRLTFGALAIAFAIGGYSSHSRLLPLVGTTVLLTVGREAWRRRWPRFCVLGLTSGMLLIASAAWTRWILSHVWDDPSDQNTVGAVWDRAQHPLRIADALLGQVWYQLAATIGAAMIGAVLIGRATLGPRFASSSGLPRTVDARVLAITTIPLLMLSAVFMSDRPRPDQYIYGRYNDAVMWPIITVGLAWIARRYSTGFERRHVALAGVTGLAIASTGVIVDLLHGDAIRERYGVRGMIAGLLPFVDDTDTLQVWRASLMATALFLVVIGAARLATAPPLPSVARVYVLGITAVMVVVGMTLAATRTEHVADLRLNGWEAAGAVTAVDALVPPGAQLGVRPVPNSRDPVVKWVPQRQRFQLYQLYLPDRSFVRDRGVDDAVGPYVFAPLADPEMVDAGARVLWSDPKIKVGLWEEPTGN